MVNSYLLPRGAPCAIVNPWAAAGIAPTKERARFAHHRQEEPLEDLQLAHLIVNKLEEHLAINIVVLDMHEVTSFTDYFVICTAESDRQAKTLLEILVEELKREKVAVPLSTEGEVESGWWLLDYNSVIVHIFSAQSRAFYRLEEFWKAAPVVLKIQ